MAGTRFGNSTIVSCCFLHKRSSIQNDQAWWCCCISTIRESNIDEFSYNLVFWLHLQHDSSLPVLDEVHLSVVLRQRGYGDQPVEGGGGDPLHPSGSGLPPNRTPGPGALQHGQGGRPFHPLLNLA